MLVDLEAQDTQAPATTTAPDTPGGTGGPGQGMTWVPLVLVFAIMYFLLIRPERKRRQRTEQMLDALKKGDEVMTNGGMFGRIAQIQDDKLTIEIADGVRVKFSRGAVQGVINKDEPAAS